MNGKRGIWTRPVEGVVLVNVELSGGNGTKEHPGASGIQIADNGHLVVLRNQLRGAETIAVYAPGVWRYVVVVDEG